MATRKKPRSRQGASSRARSSQHPSPASSGTKWLLAAVGFAVVAVVAVIAFTGGGENDPGSTEATTFDLPAIKGDERIRLADFRGNPVVVNFFASWCTACDAELPGFAELSRELEGKVSFIGVNSLETGDAMLMPERHGITWWPLARDTGGRNGSGLHAALGGRGMPITAFYDAGGSLIHVDGGALPEQLLRDRLNDFYGANV
jgi:thiol-disulfide isomerase/thioredoxin